MEYVFSGLISLAVAMLAFALQSVMKENAKLKKEKEKLKKEKEKEEADRDNALEEGLLCLLRKELIADYEKWTKNGYITPTALEQGLLMYAAYKKLGGNGMVDHMREEIEELHIEEH